MSRGFRPIERALPRWARAAVVVYLSVTVAVVVTVLLTRGLELDLDARFKEGLLLAMVVLTLPVSAAYFVIGTFSSGRPPSPGEIGLGRLSLIAVLYHLGFLLLAAVNAGVFRWIVLSARRHAPVPAAGIPDARPEYPRVQLRGVTPDARKLLWTVPLAVLLSLPQWMVAGFAWCGISGCSGGGFGVATGTEWLAVILSVVNGVILAIAVFAVRWLYPTRKRALVALAAGTLFGLLGAAVTHG
ncbi:hypothetical protein [Arthrobacter sp. ISL-72]|uniref:hypothetical protein n=1 Tax=Arthrobacter sp. ISL-72 TaxID=2819114 RepID=UPI001BE9BE23|nr:hypothetical protein [Arthrobacter sp. ISL-72]MBT2596198.1 hypothetical protein [Arthrobacter sp. ISL-72]